MTPSPPRRADSKRSSRSMEPNAGRPVIAGRKRRLRTSSSGWKSSGVKGTVQEIIIMTNGAETHV